MKYYVAGPMRGLPDRNFPAFRSATLLLRSLGHEVFDPSELEDINEPLQPLSHYLRKDFRAICDCEEIVLLPGWEKSEGVRCELQIAEYLGMEVNVFDEMVGAMPFGPWPNVKSALEYANRRSQPNILDEAKGLVCRDRNSDYGHPKDDFERTAQIWSAIIGRTITARQVALCMIGVKMSRECHRPKRDNRVDMAGYAATLDMVDEVETEIPM